jgi:hypothetical protein
MLVNAFNKPYCHQHARFVERRFHLVPARRSQADLGSFHRGREVPGEGAQAEIKQRVVTEGSIATNEQVAVGTGIEESAIEPRIAENTQREPSR